MVSSSPSPSFMTANDCLRLAIIIMSGLAAATLVFVFLDMVIKPLVINDAEAATTTTAANINLAFAQEISSEHQPTQAEKITKNVVVVESKTPTDAINRSSISNLTITPFNTCYRELDNQQQQIYKSCAILDLLHNTAFCDSEYTCVKSESYKFSYDYLLALFGVFLVS